MRERQHVAIDAVVGHQQPTCEALLDFASPVDEVGPCGLDVEGVRVSQKGPVQLGASTNRTPEVVGAYALPFSCRLYERLMRRAVISQDNSQTGHTLPANKADFDAAQTRASRDGDDRCKAALHEI